jgi:hypothetical protein
VSTSDLLADRYGTKPRKRSRWTRVAAVVAVLAIGLLVAYVAYRNLGGGPIDAEQKTFDAVSDSSVRMTFTVTRDAPDKAVDCIVRSRAQSGLESGRREVYIPAGGSSRTVTTTIATVDRAVTGEIYGCSYQVPAYLPD